ncbi:hypothetical protein M422DRAFT_191482 [Sphaerobolus stellatus SS14]|uniref:Unplaced genomic scaffold SPHSTscaffold_273, whole genome shotgun sequence n=1 Tax=Sphaerobolus stellatus (strain SS14) TaxID=990650 RepID=A0A0C9TCY6_SPHS4|nr:hypothetical protein M422DRAFT_191482 [Sphaerobolus stellatus SS14]
MKALLSEIKTLEVLDHPNVIKYLGFERSLNGHLKLFLEYMPRGSMHDHLRKHGKFDHDMVRFFTKQVVEGLEYLHSRDIIHRDIKSSNILLDDSGICKISDFGIAKRSKEIYDHHASFTGGQGSGFWMAPEAFSEGYNAKIDIWSLGCLVLEMWSGRRPWAPLEIYAVMFKFSTDRQPPPVSDGVILNEIEDNFRRQCFGGLPADRPTAAELRKHAFLNLNPGWTFPGFGGPE